MSVLVSVWTPAPPKPLLHSQMELEARVGNRTKSSPTTSLNILILRGNSNAVFKRVQEVSAAIRQLPDLTRHLPIAYSVIEEIVEGFVEDF